jgi:hypothetical protein
MPDLGPPESEFQKTKQKLLKKYHGILIDPFSRQITEVEAGKDLADL